MPIHLRGASLPSERRAEGFPFDLPVLRGLAAVEFETPVTIFVGENGSGKSTLLEALALASERVGASSEPLARDATLDRVRPLAEALSLRWSRRTRRGFFMRAEDFFGYVKRVRAEVVQHEREAARVRAERPGLPPGEQRRIAAPFESSAAALRARYGDDMDARSHGEQFLAFFRARLVPGSLVLLDEPEAPLSPTRQLALLAILKEAAEEAACQFVLATHSPILMALPGARLLGFDEPPLGPVAFDDLESVRLMRDFLNRPRSFLRHL